MRGRGELEKAGSNRPSQVCGGKGGGREREGEEGRERMGVSCVVY